MALETLKKLLFIVPLVIFPLSAVGATATAQVTANIVPISSIAVSGSAVFSRSVEEHDSKGTVQLETSGEDSSAKLKILSSLNHAYDVSVSLPADFNDEFNSTLEIVDSRLTLNKGSLTEKWEREVDFGGALKVVNGSKNESRSGYAYITLNMQ